MTKFLKKNIESSEVREAKNIKLIFNIYLAFYLLSLITNLIVSFLFEGVRGLMISVALGILLSILMGPYLFYRVLFRLPVWIPGGVEYGPNSKRWEWLVYSVMAAISPITAFIYGSIAVASRMIA
jgi:hypothetical protein